MKVLFASRLDIGLQSGGVQNKIAKLRRGLEALGVEVRLHDPWNDRLDGADVCHLFTDDPSLYPLAQIASNRGVAVAVSPVANSPSAQWVVKLKTLWLSRIPGMWPALRLRRGILQLADAVFAMTEAEKEFLVGTAGCDGAKVRIVPNGIDPRFCDATDEVYVRRFGRRPDVLFVGRLDANKNPLGLIRALEGTGLRLAIIGFPHETDRSHYEACRREAADNVEFVGPLPHSDPLLASAYAAAKVFVLPSRKEVVPQTVLEAVAAGCRVVLTRNSAMGELLGDEVQYVDPSSPADIRRKVLAAIEGPPPLAARKRLMEHYTWDQVVAGLAETYRQIAKAAPGGAGSAQAVRATPI